MDDPRDAHAFRQQLHHLRNSLNVMVNAQRCLVASEPKDPALVNLRGAFERAATEASHTIDRIETLLPPAEQA